jgi:polysaccharide export outer membrane protein
MQKRVTWIINILCLVILIVSAISCVPISKLSYFNDINEMQEPIVNPKVQKLIMPFDRLYIKVYSIDEKTNLLFNSNDNAGGSSSSTSTMGFLVDESGNINYPFVGKINVGGLSISQANQKVSEALSEYVSNASVVVRFIDNNVTVMGQVQNQGTYPFTKDKLTIYEALALGGGISQFGNRKNVILVRQEGDKIMHYKLDLSDSRIAAKDYYYIVSNDIIIVEPLKNLSTNYSNNTYSLILSSVSTLLSILIVISIL